MTSAMIPPQGSYCQNPAAIVSVWLENVTREIEHVPLNRALPSYNGINEAGLRTVGAETPAHAAELIRARAGCKGEGILVHERLLCYSLNLKDLNLRE